MENKKSTRLSDIDPEILKLIVSNTNVMFTVNVISVLNKKFRRIIYNKDFLALAFGPLFKADLLKAIHQNKIKDTYLVTCTQKISECFCKINKYEFNDDADEESFVAYGSHVHKILAKRGYRFSEPQIMNAFFFTHADGHPLSKEDRKATEMVTNMSVSLECEGIPMLEDFIDQHDLKTWNGNIIGGEELASNVKYELMEKLRCGKIIQCFSEYQEQSNIDRYCFATPIKFVRILSSK